MYENLKRANEDQTWSQGEVFDGTRTVWKSRMKLKMKHIQEDLSRKQHMKTKDEDWSTLTMRLIANPCNRSHKAVHKILTQHFGMRKVCQHLAPTSWQYTISKHCLWGSFWHPRTIKWFPKWLPFLPKDYQTPMSTSLRYSRQHPDSCNQCTKRPHRRRLQQCSQRWKDHLQQCVASEGDHAEIVADFSFLIKSAS
jgi:hypothetical protein